MSRLHLVSVPHTKTIPEYSWCAFTSLTRSWSNMMSDLGHTVYLYASDENDAKCFEHIDCNQGYVWTEKVPPYEASHPGWNNFATHAIEEIKKRYEPGDYICLAGGATQANIAAPFPDAIVVEPYAGYQGVMNNSYRVFPSYVWQAAVHGHFETAAGANGRLYDTVIPHWIDVEDQPAGDGSGDYLLYVGRLVERKGLYIVRDIAERTGLPLVVAGFGYEELVPKGAEFVGIVNPAERAKLMGAARCVLMPTMYLEAFGLVAIESMSVGTPVITTDFGTFAETNQNGLTGYRCSMLSEFCEATEKVKDLDRDLIRQYALDKYSAETVAPQYDAYFRRLETLHGPGWYA